MGPKHVGKHKLNQCARQHAENNRPVRAEDDGDCQRNADADQTVDDRHDKFAGEFQFPLEFVELWIEKSEKNREHRNAGERPEHALVAVKLRSERRRCEKERADQNAADQRKGEKRIQIVPVCIAKLNDCLRHTDIRKALQKLHNDSRGRYDADVLRHEQARDDDRVDGADQARKQPRPHDPGGAVGDTGRKRTFLRIVLRVRHGEIVSAHRSA
jgi:hypothetical protein